MHVIVADIDGVTRRRSLRRKKKEKKEREREREGRERKRESLRRKMDSFESVDNQLTQAACKTTEGQKMGGILCQDVRKEIL
jgi:predicted RNA-binding protein with RPS1 domain